MGLRDLIARIAKALANHLEYVSMDVIEDDKLIIFRLGVARSDFRNDIGNTRRTARAIRTIVNAPSGKTPKRCRREGIGE